MARALHDADVDVRIYTLREKFGIYVPVLRAAGIEDHWVGRYDSPVIRLANIAKELLEYRPHIVQATHFYTNLYAAIAGRIVGALAFGCSRNNVFKEVENSKRWGPWLLRLPPILLVNSHAAKRNAESLQIDSNKIHVISNVIDLEDFDARMSTAMTRTANQPLVIAIGRLVHQKRLDRFLAAFAQARRIVADLRAVVVGEGPERHSLERTAAALGLTPDVVTFLGSREDVPALLKQADMLVLSSDYEGFPNVVLEAMAARLPVITTPAGDSNIVVQDGRTGYVVPFDDVTGMAECVVRLSKSPGLRRHLGEAGRKRVEQNFSFEPLAGRLLSIYRKSALQHNRTDLLSLWSDKDVAQAEIDFSLPPLT
jgi:glycosyltransferase involved in cell wall biosynthesis